MVPVPDDGYLILFAQRLYSTLTIFTSVIHPKDWALVPLPTGFDV
jgi:hypothetical protein